VGSNTGGKANLTQSEEESVGVDAKNSLATTKKEERRCQGKTLPAGDGGNVTSGKVGKKDLKRGVGTSDADLDRLAFTKRAGRRCGFTRGGRRSGEGERWGGCTQTKGEGLRGKRERKV